MPRGDKTGPEGAGPTTGRGAGYCAGYDAPGYANPVPGRGRVGQGRRHHGFHATGRPRFTRRMRRTAPWGAPPATPEQEAEALRTQAKWLGEQLDSIQQRLNGLEK
jgi:hypothetical protein